MHDVKAMQAALVLIFGVAVSQRVLRAMVQPAGKTDMDKAKGKLMAGEV